MNAPASTFDSPLKQLIEVLVCPLCHSSLSEEHQALQCKGCFKYYPILPDMVMMAPDQATLINPTDVTSSDDTDAPTGEIYDDTIKDQSFETISDELADAQSNHQIRRIQHELHIVTRMLSELPASTRLLNLACRGGRFSGPMQSATRLLIEADRNPQKIREAIDGAMNPPKVAGLNCDAFQLPFADDTIEGVVCARLSHHLKSESARERLLVELLRVSSGFVVFSFNDARSISCLSRRLRRRMDNNGAMDINDIHALCRVRGATVLDLETVSPFGSRHRYACIVKEDIIRSV
ncbi:MAG: hypothetical protein DHS20C01_13370 [marine bacterium B5-7]|nr:MAG: hypothetical protein DHS20C01_13370 [marine bacterium B5-7]